MNEWMSLYLIISYSVSCTNTTLKPCEGVHISWCTLRKNGLWRRRTAAGSQTTATDTRMYRPNMAVTCVQLHTTDVKCVATSWLHSECYTTEILLSVCLSVSLSVCLWSLSVSLSVCLSVSGLCLSVCLVCMFMHHVAWFKQNDNDDDEVLEIVRHLHIIENLQYKVTEWVCRV